MAAWRILDLSAFEGEVRCKKGHLTAHYPDGTQKTAALADVSVILIGTGCSLRATVLAAAGQYGIPVLICDWRSVPVAGSWPWSEHSTVGGRQRGQLQQSLPRRKQAWKSIVRAKILGQAAVLESIGDGPGSEHLRTVSSGVRSGDADNAEATAARSYWPRLFSDPHFRRDRGSANAENSMLNYAYTILRGVVLREVVAAGLWPGAGVHHSNLRNAFPLVDDLIEPFRPVADRAVWELSRGGVSGIDQETRRVLVGILERTFDRSTGRTVGTAVRDLAQSYGMSVETGSEFVAEPWSAAPRPGDETSD